MADKTYSFRANEEIQEGIESTRKFLEDQQHNEFLSRKVSNSETILHLIALGLDYYDLKNPKK